MSRNRYSYRDLPPGRSRMLAYANKIRQRQMNNNVLNNETNRVNQIIDTSISGASGVNELSNYMSSINLDSLPSFYEYEILSELPKVNVGLISKELIDNSKIESNKNISFCTICQQDIFLDIVRVLKCSHMYHVNCIDRWFIENKKCPQCRYEINSN